MSPAPALLLLSLLALATSGCSTVVSSIRDEPIQDSPRERSLGTRIDDQSIELKAEVNLKESDPALASANINVVSYNGVVLLAGQVPSEGLRRQAAEIVGRIQNVRAVHNELTVGPSISWIARGNDTWLSSKVRSRLIFTDGVDAGPVKIVTEDRTVFLMGLISRSEADRVVATVQKTSGIRKIVRVFEYID